MFILVVRLAHTEEVLEKLRYQITVFGNYDFLRRIWSYCDVNLSKPLFF